LRPVGFVYLGVMVLTWAGNWPLMKLALGEVPPLVFVLLRLIGSLILIAPALLATRQPLLPARGERAVPFFWTQQHDLQLSYVGHAAHWDRVEIDGRLAAKDCAVTYRQSGRKLAVLTIGRDCDSLAAEIELEKTMAAGS